MIFQCPACRALVATNVATQDDDNSRAGLVCTECGAVSWLPFQGGAADDVDAPGGADFSSSVDEERVAAVVQQAIVRASAKTPEKAAGDDAGGFDGDELAELRDALTEVDIEHDNAEVATAFSELLEHWHDKDRHKKLIQQASLLDAMPALGVRYRKVLELLPDDARAQQGQKEILALAMAQMQTLAGSRSDAPDSRRGQVVAVLIVAVVLVGAMLFLVRALNRM